MSLKPFHILLVEDNPGDIRLTQEALRSSKLHIRLSIVQDGAEALTFLRQKDQYKGVSKPDLVLLDLNLPRKSGYEVLAEVKNDNALRTIPIVVLTTSDREEDIMRSYNLHANCCITKPADMRQFIRVIEVIESFWFTIVSLPS